MGVREDGPEKPVCWLAWSICGFKDRAPPEEEPCLGVLKVAQQIISCGWDLYAPQGALNCSELPTRAIG